MPNLLETAGSNGTERLENTRGLVGMRHLPCGFPRVPEVDAASLVPKIRGQELAGPPRAHVRGWGQAQA